MTEPNNLNNDDDYKSLNNPQKSNYLLVSEQYTQTENNSENNIRPSNEQLNDQFLSGKRKKFQIIFSIILYILGLSLFPSSIVFGCKVLNGFVFILLSSKIKLFILLFLVFCFIFSFLSSISSLYIKTFPEKII